MQNADVVIIGAGISGLSTGYWLAKAGMKVVIVEKGRMANEASSRATGYLSLRADQPEENPLAMAAEKMWSTLDEELGYPTEWTPKGRIWVSITEQDWKETLELRESFRRTNLSCEILDSAECRRLIPSLSPSVIGGLYTKHSGHANPQRTSQAFGWAFMDRGGVVLEQTPALGIVVESGKVKGVRTPDGIIYADHVVSSAGPQSALIGQMIGVNVPVAAVRLEAAVTAPLPPLFDIALVGHGMSVRQTKRGNIHFNGGPYEWVGVDIDREPAKPNTPLLRNMVKRVSELFPSLSNTAVLRSWAGVVDVTPDQMTILERLTSPEGLVLVVTSGHGFGMAAAVGRAAADLVLEGRSSIPIEGLGLDRFKNLPANWQELRKWLPGNYNT
ncbi:NAD(P)/FAD-dependent oxidoreductase [Pseudomonas sp. H11T01]|uniref:NAD(P)/FAD-dependent oxidoreductase n=1 Tax=Pseudomonas sp. H11T01 TaxID=3402749 RepID=UPI003ACCC99B